MVFKHAQCMIFHRRWRWYWSLSGGCKSYRRL